ncbi:hypothetical protein [Pseudomonas japonica]|uniref:hypothetical protein n=1 Tax=Pseudomonas japonica TaxID=256466 RepID=UPI002158A312|nr:hypothetical protein [Pseudomonas japonica]
MSDETVNRTVDSGAAPTAEFLKKYVFLAVKSGEVGSTNPYSASLSTGKSGLAFGNMQHDTRKNERAQKYFRKILDADVAADHLSKTKADAIYTTALSSPVSLTKKKGDMRLVNAALMRHKALVDKADEERLDEVMTQVELALTAAEANPNGPGELNRKSPNLGFIAELAMWSNRGRGLKETSAYIQNMQDISRVAWEEEYLSIQRQFTKEVEPEDFSKWQKKVNRAIKDAEDGTRALLEPKPTPKPTPEQAGTMHPYGGPNGSSGVVAYLIEADSITLRFVDRSALYMYDASRPGLAAVHEMQRLAKRGSGLTTYINQHVRKNYALKIG